MQQVPRLFPVQKHQLVSRVKERVPASDKSHETSVWEVGHKAADVQRRSESYDWLRFSRLCSLGVYGETVESDGEEKKGVGKCRFHSSRLYNWKLWDSAAPVTLCGL